MKKFQMSIGLALVLGAAACGSSEQAQLRVQAASDLRCRGDQLDVHPVIRSSWSQAESTYYQDATGCGKELPYVYDGNRQAWVSPLDRATFEMSCEKQQLRATVLDSMTVGVSGCGKKTTYKMVFGTGWVLDSAAEENAKADQKTDTK